MHPGSRAGTPAGLVLAAILLASCGGGDGGETPPPSRPVEAPEEVPALPPGWTVLENAPQGFALGAPPGWREGRACLAEKRGAGPTTVLCSPDRLVTLSISADRTNEALELAPEFFAQRTLEGLGKEGFRELDVGRPRPFAGRYDGGQASGSGVAISTGVRQDLTAVVLRRDQVATFAAIIAANADEPTTPAVAFAKRALRTLRSHPVGTP